MRRRAARALLTCLWVALALAFIYVKGRALTLDTYGTDRLRFHAIPVAISEHYRHRVHDYTAYAPLARVFQESAHLDDLIASALEMPLSLGDPTYFWAADDRGAADYVIGAFALFGPRSFSLYRFYFVVLGASCAFFLIGYRRQPGMIAVLFFALAAIYTILPVVPLANLSDALFEPPSLYEPRILDVLAFVAVLHIACAAWAPERPRGWTAALIGQIAVFVFCYHARSSLAWEAVFIAVINIAALVILWRRHDRQRVWAPLALFAIGLAALNGYKHYAYHPRYFKDMGSRTVWHNALMGLGSNPALAEKYGLEISDAKVVDAVIAYLRNRRDPRLTPEWTTTNVLNSLGGYFAFNWSVYEGAARDLNFDIWKTNTADALHCYLVDKPREAWTFVRVAWEHTTMDQRNRHDLYFRPLGIVQLLILAPALALAIGYSIPVFALVAATVVLLVTSVIPSEMFYSGPLNQMGTLLGLALLAYVLAVGAGRQALMRWPGATATVLKRDTFIAAATALSAWALAVTASAAPRSIGVQVVDVGDPLRPRRILHKLGPLPPRPPSFVAVVTNGATVQARQYMWPAALEFGAQDLASWKPSALGTPIYVSPELQRSESHLSVNGAVSGPFTYLLRVAAQPLKQGSSFFATGAVEAGGLTVGLQRDGRWVGFVNVDSPGPFAVVVRAPSEGTYSLVIANCVAGSSADRPVANVFHVDRAGWVSIPEPP